MPAWSPTICRAAAACSSSTATRTIKQQAFYVQDEIKAGQRHGQAGPARRPLRRPEPRKSLIQPRLGVSYAVPRTSTMLRASYGRTQETPYNENLVLSSSADAAVFGTGGEPLPPGKRDQVEGGVQQALRALDRRRRRATSTSTRPTPTISARCSTRRSSSRCPGIIRRSTASRRASISSSIGGFSAFTVMGHTNAIFSPPGTGGILLGGARRATSASITIRSSSRRPTCSTSSPSRSAPGRRSRGATTRASSPARCPTTRPR